MRSAVVAVLAALVAVLPDCGGSGVASEPASRFSERASVLAYVWEGRPHLVRADALTLEAIGRALDLEKAPISTWARSPKGDRLAYGSGEGSSRLTFADLRAMKRLGTINLGPNGYVAGLSWPTPRRVVAALSGTQVEVVVVDPDTRRLVARHRLPGAVRQAARVPGGLVVLVSPQDRIGPATLAAATPAGLRTAALPLETGVDPPAVLEPGLAVSPDGQRAFVAGGTHVVEVDLRTLAVAERELSEPISLLGRLRSWLEPAALAKGPLEGPVRSAAWVAGGRVLVAGWNYRRTGERTMVAEAAGVKLVDTHNWSVRTLAADASTAVVAGNTVLAFGGTQGPAGLRGIGLHGFGSDGRERFQLFGNRFVANVTAVGRYAYVSEQSGTATQIEIVDLTSGRVVRTVRKHTYMEVLRLD